MSDLLVVKKTAIRFAVLVFICVIGILALGADQPLSVDDVRLLLIGGGTPAKIASLIEQRGISFHLTPELEKKFKDDGADNSVIGALRKAENKPALKATNERAASSSKEQPSTSASSSSSSTDRQIAETLAALADHPPAAIDHSTGADRLDNTDRPMAPSFTLKDLSGNRLSLDDYKGKVVLLDFWATWCGPCRSEIPAFVRFQNQYRDRGFQVIGISVDNGVSASRAVRKFYEDYMMNYRVAMCDQNTRRIYGGLAGVPTTFLIGRDGRIYNKVVGAPANLETFEDRINALLAHQANGTVKAAGQATAKPPLVTSTTSTPSPAETRQTAGAVETPEASAPAPGTSHINTEVARARTVNPEPKPARADLSDPAPGQIQNIIQEFAAKEKLFKEARNNYTYHQSNKVEEFGVDGDIDGVYEQEWDILYDDNGQRIERVTYAPTETLKRLILTKEDLYAFRNTNPFVLTSDELSEYEVKYLGHVKVDEITAYVFSIRPRELQKGRQYFQGVIWVDDRDLQIVKSEGKPVPEPKTKGNENLFPRFTTYREQIDGKYWFPTFTTAEDTLYFATGSVHMKEIIRYSEYKQFKSKTRILSATPTDQPNAKPIPETPPPNEKQ